MLEEIIRPPLLQRGDNVAVIAPAGLVDRNKTERAIALIESWGLRVSRGEHLYERHGIFAGTDGQRLADLQRALDDSSVKAVICARGGYGMSRIIADVDFSAFRKEPKWVLGYSDITVLHLFINYKTGVSTLHGEMPLNYNENANSGSLATIPEVLFKGPVDYEWDTDPLREGVARGLLVGGNLSLISNLMGTWIREYLEGKILFIEERGEYLYSLDRMIRGLALSGVLGKIRGLIIGGLSGMKESDTRYACDVNEIITESIAGYSYPFAFGFPAGHIKDNRALVTGASVRLDVSGGRASLVYE
jgi:muramoyltetrapeptide carboxypeptidase